MADRVIYAGPGGLRAAMRRVVRETTEEHLAILRGPVAVDLMAWGEQHAAGLFKDRVSVGASSTGSSSSVQRFYWRVNGEEAVLSNEAPYWFVLELGRRPGRRPPPIKAIHEWARLGVAGGTIDIEKRPGQTQAQAIRSFAYAVRTIIAKNGTKPKFILRDTAEAMQAHLPAVIDKHLR